MCQQATPCGPWIPRPMKTESVTQVWLCPPVCLGGQPTHDPHGEGVWAWPRNRSQHVGAPDYLLHWAGWEHPEDPPVSPSPISPGTRDALGAKRDGGTHAGDSSSAHTCRPLICREGAGGAGKDKLCPMQAPALGVGVPYGGGVLGPSALGQHHPFTQQDPWEGAWKHGCWGGGRQHPHLLQREGPQITRMPPRARDPHAERPAKPVSPLGETGKRGTPGALHACRTPQRGHTTCPEQPSRTARRFISMSGGGNGPGPPPRRAAQWREGALLPAHAIGRI